MNRWWDDLETARDVLERVDGSDVVQGVGTATLGLHALSRAALAPLASETLVDAGRVHDALVAVDTAPVARAIAAATEPIMGEASQAYGVMLASELHAQGAVGAQAMVTQLTAAGVPMPLALERVSQVVGVPAGYAGAFTAAMKASEVAPIVAADAGDRALMAYAAAQGHLEAGAAGEVSKSEFEEFEHPRDVEGRFAVKPSAVSPRRARMARRARRERREVTVAPPPQISERASLAGLARLIKAPVVLERAKPERARQERSRGERTPLSRVKAQAEGAGARKGINEPWATAGAKAHVDLVEFTGANLQAVPVSGKVLGEILGNDGAFVAGRLADTLGPTGLLAGSKLYAENFADYAFIERGGPPTVGPGGAILRFHGHVPINDTEDVGSAGKVAEAAIDPGASFVIQDLGETLELVPPYEGAQPRAVKVYEVMLANEEHYQHAAKYTAHYGGKALEVWEDHKAHQVDRDETGQFATAGTGPRASRMARRARRARRARLEALGAAPMEGARASVNDLRDLAALVRAKPARGKVERSRVERGRPDRGPVERASDLQAQEPEPKHAYRGTAQLQAQQAWRMDAASAALLLGNDFFEVPFGPRTVMPFEEGSFGIEPPRKFTDPASALASWVENGSGNPTDDVPMVVDDEDEAWDFLDELTEGYDPLDPYAPDAVKREIDAGQWEINKIPYDEGAEPYLFVGSPAAMAALRAKDTPMRVEQVGTDTHDLARAFGADPKYLAGRNVACVAIVVSFPDDEQEVPSAWRP